MGDNKLSFDKMFKTLESAREQYENYLNISEELSPLLFYEIEEEYNRDMNHPLSLSIKG